MKSSHQFPGQILVRIRCLGPRAVQILEQGSVDDEPLEEIPEVPKGMGSEQLELSADQDIGGDIAVVRCEMGVPEPDHPLVEPTRRAHHAVDPSTDDLLCLLGAVSQHPPHR